MVCVCIPTDIVRYTKNKYCFQFAETECICGLQTQMGKLLQLKNRIVDKLLNVCSLLNQWFTLAKLLVCMFCVTRQINARFGLVNSGRWTIVGTLQEIDKIWDYLIDSDAHTNGLTLSRRWEWFWAGECFSVASSTARRFEFGRKTYSKKAIIRMVVIMKKLLSAPTPSLFDGVSTVVGHCEELFSGKYWIFSTFSPTYRHSIRCLCSKLDHFASIKNRECIYRIDKDDWNKWNIYQVVK